MFESSLISNPEVEGGMGDNQRAATAATTAATAAYISFLLLCLVFDV